MKTPADDILLLLKTRGPGTTLGVAERLGVSRQAARVQLEKLAEQGLVAHAAQRTGVGRPKRTWSLSDAGHQRFPDTHAQMTVELIEAVREEFGAKGLERLVARRERATERAYRQALGRDRKLETRLDRLVRIRSDEGYMAEWRAEPQGGYLLVENHCPICAAATACQGFCRSELALFEKLLAPAQVVRVEHLLAGARRCAYRVTPA
ncbi:MAG TPA: metalloregulator ArsR/SmtB family transcription factor [Phenylobacterium sp.]|nr:metalloregulator ArsR/SmtB family transcription factor [Phenylobacterium sp.]